MGGSEAWGGGFYHMCTPKFSTTAPVNPRISRELVVTVTDTVLLPFGLGCADDGLKALRLGRRSD